MQYVILPNIKKLEIGNFQLYKNNYFTWDFNNGMNLFLGINGLGKTTTIKTLAYAIVGLSSEKNESDLSKEELRALEGIESKSELKEFTEIKDVGILDKNYFRRYKVIEHKPYVKIEFELKDKKIKLKRNLLDHKVESLEINESIIEGDLDQEYTNIFEIYSGIELKNFKKILYTLLIRTEEAPSLLFRPIIQHIVLRTLLFDKDFHGEFLTIEKRLRAAESDYRHNNFEISRLEKVINEKKDDIESFSKAIDDLYNQLSDENRNKKEKLERLESKKEELSEEEVNVKNKSIKILNEINELNNNLKSIDIDKSELEYKLQEKDDQIINIKRRIYKDIYCEDDIYTLALNAIVERKSCIFCNSGNIDEIEIRRITNGMNKGKCSFCNSKINRNEYYNDSSLDGLDGLYMELKKERNSLSKSLEQVIAKADDIKLKIGELTNINNKNVKEIYQIQNELGVIKNLIDKIRLDSIGDTDEQVNKLINQKRKEILELSASIEIDKKKYNELMIENFGSVVDHAIIENDEEQLETMGGKKGECINLRNIYENLIKESDINIKEIEEKLIAKFNRYNILNNFCLHRIVSKNLDKNISLMKYSTFVPKNIFNEDGTDKEDIRSSEDMLSKSEQVMLDYAFRIALIELYMELSKNKSFIAFETSEGVLDAKHVVQFANMLLDYSKRNKLICISNLHDEEFIKNLFEKELSNNDKLSKTLNFITMSSKNIEDIEFYDSMWKRIFGKEILQNE